MTCEGIAPVATSLAVAAGPADFVAYVPAVAAPGGDGVAAAALAAAFAVLVVAAVADDSVAAAAAFPAAVAAAGAAHAVPLDVAAASLVICQSATCPADAVALATGYHSVLRCLLQTTIVLR